MNKNKKNIQAVAEAGEIYTKEFFSRKGKIGMANRWANKTPEERKEWGKFLASTRKKSLSTDDSGADNI